MFDVPIVIGYDIDKAIQLIGDKKIVTEMTQTPFLNKQKERQENKPVVVRQLVEGDAIKLTISLFR